MRHGLPVMLDYHTIHDGIDHATTVFVFVRSVVMGRGFRLRLTQPGSALGSQVDHCPGLGTAVCARVRPHR